MSDSLVAKNTEGRWMAHITFQGQQRDRTILRLRADASGFGDAAHPKGVLVTGSHWQEGDKPDGGGNKAFRNNVFDLTIDTGTGNAGAVGIDYAVSNQGAIERVTITGDGAAGITCCEASGAGLDQGRDGARIRHGYRHR